MTSGTRPHVILYERQGCHLCDDARAVVEAEVESAGASLERVDIDQDASLVARFGELVPVVEIDGEPHSQWFVEAERLRAALNGDAGSAR